MNLRQLNTLVAILQRGSFTAAGEDVSLSHSAVSIQMKQLEDELGVNLFNRATRPPGLTAMGEKLALLSQQVLMGVDNIRDTASGQSLVGSISIGIVPTASASLLPLILEGLQAQFPGLQVNVKSDTSAELASLTARQELDFAILTSPLFEAPELSISEIAAEPLYVVGPAGLVNTGNDTDLLQSRPFIAFSKKTWLGQQISARLQSRGIHVQQIMEIDSLGVIETLVAKGFGISIIPQRHLAPPIPDTMVRVPFCNPIETRMLVMIQPSSGLNREIATTIKRILAHTG